MKRTSPTGRRRGVTAAVAITTASALLLGACSGAGDDAESSTSPDSSPAPAGEIDPEAIIEAGISYALGGSFDPMLASGAVTQAANWSPSTARVDPGRVQWRAAPHGGA